MRLRPGSYFLIFVMMLSLAVALGTLSLRYQSIKILPMIIGGLIFVLAGIALVRDLISKKDTRGPEEETPLSIYWRTGLWILALALGIYIIGFLIAIPIFIILYLKKHDTKWLKSIIVGAITTTLLYLAFEVALKVDLYRGLLFSWLLYGY